MNTLLEDFAREALEKNNMLGLKGQCHENFVLTETVGVWARSY